MTGAAVETSLDFADAKAKLSALSEADLSAIADAAGALIEDQTKLRLNDAKTAPDGTPWAAWSVAYAEKIAGKSARSLLIGVGNPGLLESISNVTTGTDAIVGSNLIYAAIHQFGGDVEQGHAPIPARPYLGLSSEDEIAITDLVSGKFEELVQ